MLKLIPYLSLVLSTSAFAFPCYLTVVKDSCWTKYDVTVKGYDLVKSKEMTKIVIPKDKGWARVRFVCQPNQTLKFQAMFSPAFWEKDKGKTYDAKKYNVLPNKVTDNELGWQIPVCFPRDFAEVPLPPEVSGKCVCDMTQVDQLILRR